jgi:hypothetical protein
VLGGGARGVLHRGAASAIRAAAASRWWKSQCAQAWKVRAGELLELFGVHSPTEAGRLCRRVQWEAQ